LINLRGQIVLAMNLRRRFQLDMQPTRSPRANLIVHTGDGLVSLRVDQLGDVISLDREQLEPLPPSVPRQMRELARGVFQLDDSLLILLDVNRVATQEACVEAD
jgi:purine-binding chemotaxis protein CheW